ncbi:MAG TPA: DUF805 domain-containing protein [Propionibacteriaceae bacterium]|nr:DUF805 domain-containing protein [Propionibacteriaceae bacterium]
MTNNWDWNRTDGPHEGAESEQNAAPAEGGQQTPPPWNGAEATPGQADAAGTAAQTPWSRPNRAEDPAEADRDYGQAPWDAAGAAPSAGADQGFTQAPWDRDATAGDQPAGEGYTQTPWAAAPGARADASYSPGEASYSLGEASSYATPSRAETPPQPGTAGAAYGSYGAPGAAYGQPSGPSGYGQATPQDQPGSAPGYGAGGNTAPYGSGAPYGGQPSATPPYQGNSYGAPQFGGTPAFGGAPYQASPYGQPAYGFGGPQVPMRPRMGFMQAMTAWVQNYARFNGRAGLSEYWWTVLGQFVVVLVLDLLLSTAGRSADGSTNGLGVIVSILLGIWSLATIIPSLSVTVRRLHDTNRSGWTWLLGLIPLVGGIIVLVFTLGGSNPAGARFDGVDQPRTGD